MAINTNRDSMTANFNNTDPNKLGLLNALFVTSFFTLVYVVFSLVFYSFQFLPLLLFDALLFVFCYFVFRYTLDKFIYSKIKLIYKTIHNLKVSKGDEKPSEITAATIENVSLEVQKWGEGQQREIENLKEMARYRREFLGNISHELKTPIFLISRLCAHPSGWWLGGSQYQ